MRTMAAVTAMAWSFCTRALNIFPTETASMPAVDRSFTFTQVRTVKTTKSTATRRENHLKPTISIILAPASRGAKRFPRMGTSIMVNTVTRALPTPALVRARVVRPSRSRPPWVKAGIMDQ